MGYRHRNTSRADRLGMDNFLVGVAGMVAAVALGTVAATVALSGHYGVAVAIGVLALAFAVPAVVQALGELLDIALLLGTLVAFVLLLPAFAVSPALRHRARGHWSKTRR